MQKPAEKRRALRGMRSDIISTSRLEPKWDFLWQNRQAAPTLPMAAGIGQWERGETAHGTGADEAWTSMEACPVARDREGSAVPAVSAPFPFPVPRPPGTTPTSCPDPPLPHLLEKLPSPAGVDVPVVRALFLRPPSSPNQTDVHDLATDPNRSRRRRRPRHRPPEPASTL